MYEIKKACVYARVSTDEQAKKGYSVDEQVRMCRAQIDAKGWEYAGTFTDPGVSGRKLDRPGLNAMIEKINAGDIGAVVIYKLDRLSRKQKDTMHIIENVIMANDVYLYSLNETLDTSTPWGRAMIGILSAFNQMESETIQMRTTDGRMAKAKQGGYAGGKPPLGYRSREGELVIVPEEAEIVRAIFSMRKEGKTLMGIAEKLNEMGYRSKSGKLFRHSAVQTILANESVYRGVHKYGDGGEGYHEPILKEEN